MKLMSFGGITTKSQSSEGFENVLKSSAFLEAANEARG